MIGSNSILNDVLLFIKYPRQIGLGYEYSRNRKESVL